jgi:hypothetical protein
MSSGANAINTKLILGTGTAIWWVTEPHHKMTNFYVREAWQPIQITQLGHAFVAERQTYSLL